LDRDRLQSATLQVLAKGADGRLGKGRHYLAEAISAAVSPERVSAREVQQTVWSLVAQGLAYIDFSQAAPENWVLELTPEGHAAATDSEANPDDPSGYLKKLVEDVPGLSTIVNKYAVEALHCYNSRLYLASSVMLGVASEAAFLELGRAFGEWLSSKEQENFKKVFENPRSTYIAKFTEFRKRLEPVKNRLPKELGDGINLWLDSVLDLLRVRRNDAGHPSEVAFDRDDCFINLRMFIRYVRKMYLLKQWFGRSLDGTG
jgi:hypothetical protein